MTGFIYSLYGWVKKFCSDYKQLQLGQLKRYDLLQLAHRLEKGMLIKKPKPLWGWEKAYRMAELIKNCDDTYLTTTSRAVLSAFLETKASSVYKEDRDRCDQFLKETKFEAVNFSGLGGTQMIRKTVYSKDELKIIENLFESRHSCREYSDNPISDEKIRKAVQWALRCPSACNRQPFKVYAIETSRMEEKLSGHLQYSASRILIITGDIRAFKSSEMLDWIVSPSIFAAYLTLSLHAFGIGSCVVRKDLIKDDDYKKAIRDMSGMTDSEQIVLEMFIGEYKDEYLVPVSNRANTDDIITFV